MNEVDKTISDMVNVLKKNNITDGIIICSIAELIRHSYVIGYKDGVTKVKELVETIKDY